MELMQSMAYYIEFQRQLAAAQQSCQEQSSTALDAGAGPVQELGETNFNWRDALPVERIKAALTELAMAIVMFAAVAAFGLGCVLSPTLLP